MTDAETAGQLRVVVVDLPTTTVLLRCQAVANDFVPSACSGAPTPARCGAVRCGAAHMCGTQPRKVNTKSREENRVGGRVTHHASDTHAANLANRL
jgi:hypothetical protein